MSLFSRLLALMIIVGIAPLIPTGALLIYYQKQAKENVLTTHHGFAAAASASIYQYIKNLNQRLVFYKSLERALVKNQKTVAENILKSAMESNNDFLITAVLDKDGSEEFKIGTRNVLRDIDAVNRGASEVFLTAKKTGKIAVSNFKFISGVPAAEIILPLKKNYLFLAVDFSKLWMLIQKQKTGVTGRTYLADEKGRIFNFYNELSPNIDVLFLRNKFKNAPSDKLIKIPSKFGNFVGAYEKVPDFNLYVITLQLKKEAFWAITLTSSIILFLVFAISTAAYFAAWFFTSKLSLPIAGIIDGARRVTGQNFSIPVPQSKSFVELEQLITSFNSMMKEVKKYSDLQIDKVIEEKNKTDLLIKLMHDGLILSDIRGKILYSNAIARSIVASKDFELVLQGKNKKPIEILAEKISGKSKLPDIFKLHIGTAVSPYYYKLKYSIYDKSMQEPLIIMVFHDITLERQIDKMKEDFFNSVAHDLRAPLVGLQGYIQLLKQSETAKEKRKKYLQSMETSSKKVIGLIEDILDVSKMESGTLGLNRQNFNLTDFINGVIISLKPHIKAKKLKLEFKLPKKPAIINADEHLLERVFNNLLSNAVKYTPKAKKITVAYKSLEKFHQFTVKDQGKGIAPEQLEKIFDKFYQTRDTDQSSGYGLGLAITKKIVELHGGEIKALSKPGQGTAVTFSLGK